jgi:hypothetical protein
MKTCIKSTIFTLIILGFLSISLFAQSPQLINYQAVVRNSSGEPITDSDISILFTINRLTANGTEVYSESHSAHTNSFGLVSLQVGNGTTSGDIGSIDWSLGPYFLNINAAGNDLDAVQIVSVPYSLYADKAGNVFSGLYNDLSNKPDLSGFITSETDPTFGSSVAAGISSGNISNWNSAYGWGNHSIQGYIKDPNDADASPTNELQTLGRTGNAITLSPSGGSVDLGYLLDSKWLSGGGNIYYNAGNVGVGTSTPKSTLSVEGTTANDTAIFEVVNNQGQRVFAVYNDGVRIIIDEDYAKGPRGGFAIGGFSNTKGTVQDYLKVTSDSTRIYVDQSAKGPRGGFAIGGFDREEKGTLFNFVNLSPENSLIGQEAGESITTGINNAFFGNQAGMNLTTGDDNIFLGYQSGYSNNSNDNVMIGNRSGFSNIGYSNIFVGYDAGLYSNSTTHTTFIGNSAGYNMVGDDNIAIGDNAGRDMNIEPLTHEAFGTVILGIDAGRNFGGSGNTFLGYGSGSRWDGTSGAGDSNTFVGAHAGAGGSSHLGTGNVAVGYQAGYNKIGDNKLYIANNETTALIYGDFANELVRISGTVGIDTDPSPSTAKLYSYDDNTANSNAPAIKGDHNMNTSGWGVGVQGIGGYMGVSGIANVTGTGTRFGVYASASGGSSNYGLYASGSTYAGYFSGNVYISGTLSNPSDITLKKNISPLSNSLEKVLSLRGVSYEWKSASEIPVSKASDPSKGEFQIDLYNFPAGRQLGVIAQEVEEIIPDLVVTGPDGVKSVDYLKMTPLLIEAIKEQQKMIDEQKIVIDQLLKRMEILENSVESRQF